MISVTPILKKIERALTKKKNIQDVLKVFSSNILTLGVSFISSVLVARNLGVQGKGFLTVLLVYPGLIMTLSQMGIRQASVYEIGRKKFSYANIVKNIASMFLIMSILGAVGCFFLISSTNQGNFTTPMMLLAVLTIPFGLIQAYTGGIFLGKEKIGLSTVFGWLPPVLNLLFLVFLVIILKMGIIGVLLSTLFAGIPVVAYAIYKVSREVKLNLGFDKEIFKSLLSLGAVYALAVFINSLNYRIDIILLEKLSNAKTVGLYSIGVNFAELVLQVPAAIGLVIFSRSSNASNSAEFSKKMIKPLTYGLLIGIVIALLIIAISPVLIPFIYSQRFSGSVPMLQLLMPGIIALIGYKIIGFDLAGKGKPWVSVFSSIPGLVVNIILNFILIPEYGGRGAAIASSISYTVMALVQWVVYKRILKKIKDKEI